MSDEVRDRDRQLDWRAAEATPEFRRLVAARRRFVVPATIFFLAVYLGFIALAGYAPGFMGERIHQGLTVGYVLALLQFVMVFVLGWLYLRRANRVFDGLEAEAAKAATEAARGSGTSAGDGEVTR